ncbi:UDP-glycosyltransferase 86A1-like [Salvia miltiorrhiza]|uniref:UDP-glycosyltransferase 86A1-like n=1 Tax=Salvia miltiorrhiza TaxID=226208 RepID=UPI0025ABC785|nr:UDP-glycosyltransferase 86A1-like [Salvia miltiorrhiza]
MKQQVEIKAHAIMITLPYQGHLNPFVDLAMQLASKGITVTFVHTQHAHHLITTSRHTPTSDIFSAAPHLDIRYATISDGFPLDFDRDLNWVDYWESLIRDFPSRVSDLVGDIISSSDPSLPPFLVADTFAAWPAMVAQKYNLLNVSFWTQPATEFAIDYHLHLLKQNGHYPPNKDDDEHVINYIPGVAPISTKDLMSHLQEADPTIAHEIVFRAFKEVVKADFILHNTVQELEPHTLSVLSQKQATYAIGPINFSTKTKTSVPIPKSLRHQVDCSKWLDARPRRSVLYISFGSIAQTNREVIQEIAHGLVVSGVSFIWVIRPQIVIDDGTDVLPAGFDEDVKDRGLVVPWCDQLAVLSSPAVGGFLTHCGWNSILESVWCGVPMICYPILYDQPTNRKLVVDDWKIGINLCNGESVCREEVAEKIKKVMSGEASDANLKEIRSKLHDAWSEDGSSHTNFDRFLKDLNHKI